MKLEDAKTGAPPLAENEVVEQDAANRLSLRPGRGSNVVVEPIRPVQNICARLAVRSAERATVDNLIAATARVHQLTVVTRNTADFAGCDVPLLNPWQPQHHRS